MTTYHVPPEHQGQIVEDAFADAGEHGVLCRTTDHSDGAVRYYLFPWLRNLHPDAPFDPWNGSPFGRLCRSRGKRISAEQAERLADRGN